MEKSAEAFRTISEVSELLNTPAHVLRFWESRFSQVKPVKRAGGRRYYRPNDLALLGGIKKLLHEDGLTIRGVQKILKEQGVRHVAGMSIYDISQLGTEDENAAAEAPAAKSEEAQQELPWPSSPSPEAAKEDEALKPDLDDVADRAPRITSISTPGPRPGVSPGAERRAELGRRAAPEAPMDVDVPTLPRGAKDNVLPLDGEATSRARSGGQSTASTATDTTLGPPAANMLRAMDALRARDKKAELMSVYLRLSRLHDRVASGSRSTND